MTYLTRPTHYAPAEFRALLRNLVRQRLAADVSDPAQYRGPFARPMARNRHDPQERWGANLNAYYQRLGWHAGPHLVVCPDYVWNLSDLQADEVSVSCFWNSRDARNRDGPRLRGRWRRFRLGTRRESARQCRIRARRAFKSAGDIGKTLRFHRECAADHHACPGSRVAKDEIVQRVNALLENWGATPAPLSGYGADEPRPRQRRSSTSSTPSPASSGRSTRSVISSPSTMSSGRRPRRRCGRSSFTSAALLQTAIPGRQP